MRMDMKVYSNTMIMMRIRVSNNRTVIEGSLRAMEIKTKLHYMMMVR